MEENKGKIVFLRENCNWIFSGISGFTIIIWAILNFIEYITAVSYFNFYGLDINLYNYGDRGFIYGLIVSIIYLLAMYSIIYCIKQIKNGISKFKSNWKIIFEDFLIIFFSNLYLSFSLPSKLDNQSFLFNFIIISIFEIILYFVLSKQAKKINEEFDVKFEMVNYFKKLPFLIIIFLVLISLRAFISLSYNTEYKIIDDDKVIVYSSNDYYLVLNCEIENDNIIIYKGVQTKISNIDVESKIIKFKSKELR